MDGNGAGRDGSAAVAEETHVVAAARRRLEGFSAVDRRKHVATILVLEHDPVLRELMERNLSGEGFRVVSMSGSTGLEQLVEQHRPALLVLDIDAPTMIPAELAAALRDGDLAGHVPLVLVGPPHLPQALSSMRATEYLAKPLNWGMLVASCKKWARAQPQPDDAVPVLHAGGG
jgi:CheY-like chemotaxis protein